MNRYSTSYPRCNARIGHENMPHPGVPRIYTNVQPGVSGISRNPEFRRCSVSVPFEVQFAAEFVDTPPDDQEADTC